MKKEKQTIKQDSKKVKKELKQNAEMAKKDLEKLFKDDLENPDYKAKLNKINKELKKSLKIENKKLREQILEINEDFESDKKIIKDKFTTIKEEEISKIRGQEKEIEMKQSKDSEKGILVKKNDKRVQELLKSDSPENEAWKLGLDYKDGKTKLVLEVTELDDKTLEKIEKLGEINVKNDNLVQITTSIDNLPRINSIDTVEKTRTPYSLSDYAPTLGEKVISPMAKITTNEVAIQNLEKMIYEDLEKDSEEFDSGTLSKLERDTLDAVNDIQSDIENIILQYEENSDKNEIKALHNAKKELQNALIDERNALKEKLREKSLKLSKVYEENKVLLANYKQKISKEISDIRNNVNSDDKKSKKLDRLVQLSNKIEKIEETEKVVVNTSVKKDSNSEGVYYSNVDIVHSEGITGKDVKVAVLDLVFDTSNEKIKDNIVESKSFRSGLETTFIVQDAGNENKIAHGTAVAEIVTEIAPESNLYLYEMDTDVEFAAAVDQAIANNVDVIAMAAGWPNLQTDGSSHITKKVEEAISHGITFVVPSGNFAKKHWEGNYNDSNLNGWHQFESDDEGLSIEVTQNQVFQQKPIVVYLSWDDGNGDVTDLDLVLVDPTGQIVEYSANPQKTSSDLKSEYVFHMPEMDGVYALGISQSDEVSAVDTFEHAVLEIFSVNNDIEYPIASGSAVVPADAKGAIVVGAISTIDGAIEPFSSHGPTNDGRAVPHVVGPNGVTTLAYNGELFYGTSATTPYVAGIAALMVGTDSDLTPDELLDKIQENAVSDHTENENQYKNVLGHGTIDALFLIEQ